MMKAASGQHLLLCLPGKRSSARREKGGKGGYWDDRKDEMRIVQLYTLLFVVKSVKKKQEFLFNLI